MNETVIANIYDHIFISKSEIRQYKHYEIYYLNPHDNIIDILSN